ncbi:hypothetical protein C8Q74DRAFT_1308142 [Fomes fomentarius]|nr:hypothetical protein C8Q74DRAFT_1308142 [Fomes fomentarius]
MAPVCHISACPSPLCAVSKCPLCNATTQSEAVKQPSKLLALPVDMCAPILSNLDEFDMARLAQTCRDLHSQAESFRFRHVVIFSFRGFRSLKLALEQPVVDRRGIFRVHRLRSLALRWTEGSPPYLHILQQLLHMTLFLQTLKLYLLPLSRFDNPYGYQLSLAHLMNLRYLHLNGSFSRHVHQPPPSLTSLSIVEAYEEIDYPQVATVFGSVVRKLRIIRIFGREPEHFEWESPAHITAAMGLFESLEYLEVNDRTTNETNVLVREAPTTPLLNAGQGLENLRRVVWCPAWASLYKKRPARFARRAQRYLERLPVEIEDVTIHLCVKPGSAYVGKGGREDGKGEEDSGKVSDLIVVDPNEWSRLE